MARELESAKSSPLKRTDACERVEEQLHAVLEASLDALVVIGADDRMLVFNGSASRMFGYAAQEVIGRDVRMLLPPQQRAQYDECLLGYRATRPWHGIPRAHELTACRRDGVHFPALLSMYATSDADLIVGCLRDLSADKALQEEVLRIAALERQRIGQELHDGTQQELTGLGLLVHNLSEQLREDRSDEAQLADRIAAGITEANRRVRSMARGLVPVQIDGDSLPAALDELARGTQETYKLACRLECSGRLEIPDAGIATHLYRIAQEAVSNAARHARADAVLIKLAGDEHRLRLEVHDNGVGIRKARAVSGGVGLRLMEHRCAAIGGRFRVQARPDGGTVVTCAVPLRGKP